MFKRNGSSSAKSSQSRPQLHVFLGAGGVGKTTLSAGFALALARQGYSVGLISVDPAKRLKGALGVEELTEKGTMIEGVDPGKLEAAFLNVSECFSRWIQQEGMSAESQSRLFENRLFRGVVDKFASSTDTFAAVRLAEWGETPRFDHIVVDTAPGLQAVDFLSKPDKLIAFLDGKLIDWIKWFVGGEAGSRSMIQRVVKSGARRVLDGLAQIGGQNFLLNFGEFLILLDGVFLTMFRRLESVSQWFRSESARFYLVTAVREDAVYVGRKLGQELDILGIQGRCVIINKAFPEELNRDPGFQAVMAAPRTEPRTEQRGMPQTPFLNYLSSYHRLQSEVTAEMSGTARTIITIPLASGLDGTESIRLEDLVKLGNHILGTTKTLGR
jgi:anion-transporting  ArsA/GET3 family ATPase